MLSVVADDSLDQYYEKYKKYLVDKKSKRAKTAECIVEALQDQDIAKRFGPETLNNDSELFRNFDVFLSNAEELCKDTTPDVTPTPSPSPDKPSGGDTPWAVILSIVGAVVVAIAAAAGFFIVKKKTHKPVSTNAENVEM